MSNIDPPTMPTGPREPERPPRRRNGAAARRRLLLLVVSLAVVGIAIWASYGPIQAYQEARARLEQASAGVAKLQTEKNELQARLGKLSEAGYLEDLARQELGFLRPGEELYIVTGLEAGLTAGDESTAGDEPATRDDPVTRDQPAGNDEDAADTENGLDGDSGGDDQGASNGGDLDEDAADEREPALGSGPEEGPGLFERAVSGFLDLF